jgi:hypothetical protein
VNNNTGLAIGGPKMGQHLTQVGTLFYVAQRPRLKLSDLSPTPYPDATVEPFNCRRGRYEFDGFAWWWQGWQG